MFLAIQMSHDGSTAAGTWALVLLLDERDLRRRWLAMPLLIVAVMSSAMGLFFAAAAVVIAVIGFRRRRDTPLIVAPAIVVYAIWHALYNRGAIGGDTLSMANVNAAIEYAREGVVLAIANASGHGPEVGTVLAVLLGTLLIRQVVFRAELEPGLWAATAGLISSFLVVGLTRNSIDGPGTSRYLYVGCIFVVIIAAAALRPGRDATHRLGFAAALGVLAGTSLLWNLGQLDAGVQGLQSWSDRSRATVSLLLRYGGTPALPNDGGSAEYYPPQIPKPPRLRALVDRLGSPVDDAVSGPVPEPTWAMDLMLVGMADPPIAAISPVTLPVSPRGRSRSWRNTTWRWNRYRLVRAVRAAGDPAWLTVQVSPDQSLYLESDTSTELGFTLSRFGTYHGLARRTAPLSASVPAAVTPPDLGERIRGRSAWNRPQGMM